MDEELIQMDSNIKDIRNLIFTIRNKQVILDSDIAMLYEVETKKLNQAVKRNIERFPEEFCFRLNEQEYNSLRSQIVTLKNSGRGQHKKYLPYAFTEQGIAMLSAVLHSQKAIEVSINIMKAFVEMRKFIINNQILFEKISNIELKQIEYQRKTNKKFDEIFKQIESNKQINQKVFFEKQIYDAFSLIVELIRKANREIILIDNYVDIDTLNILAKKNNNTNVIIYTKKETVITDKDVRPSYKYNLEKKEMIVEIYSYKNGFSIKSIYPVLINTQDGKLYLEADLGNVEYRDNLGDYTIMYISTKIVFYMILGAFLGFLFWYLLNNVLKAVIKNKTDPKDLSL